MFVKKEMLDENREGTTEVEIQESLYLTEASLPPGRSIILHDRLFDE